MKLALLVIAVTTVYIASAVPVRDDAFAQEQLIQIPDVKQEGNIFEDLLVEEGSGDEILDSTGNSYHLFTRSNPQFAQLLLFGSAESIQRSSFNPNFPTVIVVHGWLSSQDNEMGPSIRDAYLNKGEANVIIVDWSRQAVQTYVNAAREVFAVGVSLAAFIAHLSSVTGVPYGSIHIVGFNLGAHVAGNAGRTLNGQIGRITGLDPSGQLFNVNPDRLGENDARYVEIIHTDGDVDGIGLGWSIGHVDFYANGGNSQPGCLTSICNHNRAWRLFSASVTYNHLVGYRCDRATQLVLNLCRGQQLRMGNDELVKNGSGTYRVNTGMFYPY